MTGKAVATFNIGSSSLKFSLFSVSEENELGQCLCRGAIRDLSHARNVSLEDKQAAKDLESLISDISHPAVLVRKVMKWLISQHATCTLIAAGHRVVHGGQYFKGPVLADITALDKLDRLSVLAPAHQPYNLAGVRALKAKFPDLHQTLSFDTAFHRTMPRVAELYALPRDMSDAGILRFGFHGLSYAHITETLMENFNELPGRVLGLHLGSGASACAMVDGKSIATSMGLTALDGLPMATRCGDLDPGVVLHLIKDRGYTTDQVFDILYNKSGLLGVSGLSADIRTLLDSPASEAREAIELYCYRIAREAGSLAVAMGGLDAIVFSGGVGENAPEVRRRIVDHLYWLGVMLDPAANRANEKLLSPAGSGVPVMRIVADEERIIARECVQLTVKEPA